MAITTRFAPSPNGPLHLGHALSALVAYSIAQRLGGRFLLRIEDIDVGRTREPFVQSIFDDLKWLGLSWPEPVLRQSTRFAAYRNATAQLQALDVLYPCFATRKEIAAASRPDAPRDPDGALIYPGLHKSLSTDEIRFRRDDGQAFALRLDMARALEIADSRLDGGQLTYRAVDASGNERATLLASARRWGDAVVVRKDVPTSYHLAVVVDDALQGVSHVTRGKDLEASTDLHRLLQVLLGLPEPVYHHHVLVLDDAGAKLSKSDGARSLSEMREAGASRSDVLQMIGWS